MGHCKHSQYHVQIVHKCARVWTRPWQILRTNTCPKVSWQLPLAREAVLVVHGVFFVQTTRGTRRGKTIQGKTGQDKTRSWGAAQQQTKQGSTKQGRGQSPRCSDLSISACQGEALASASREHLPASALASATCQIRCWQDLTTARPETAV